MLAVGLSACAPDAVSESFLSGENTGYVAADGAIVEIPVAERGEPVEFAGVTEHGEDFDSADIAGQVAVANFGYPGSAPCRAEAPDVHPAAAKPAFAKVVPISAPPTTLVLDKQGRVAAKIIGPIDGTSVLSTLVKDALAEDS